MQDPRDLYLNTALKSEESGRQNPWRDADAMGWDPQLPLACVESDQIRVALALNQFSHGLIYSTCTCPSLPTTNKSPNPPKVPKGSEIQDHYKPKATNAATTQYLT
jgi:hypothetical protein